MRMSFGTNVSTVCSCSGCLYVVENKNQIGDWTPIILRDHREFSVPALFDINHIFLAHLGSFISVLGSGLCKTKETIELRANITSFTYSLGEWEDLLRQFVYDFQLSVFLILQVSSPLFIVTVRSYR